MTDLAKLLAEASDKSCEQRMEEDVLLVAVAMSDPAESHPKRRLAAQLMVSKALLEVSKKPQ